MNGLDDLWEDWEYWEKPEEAIEPFPKERPRFGKKRGRQVRTLRGVKKGQLYIDFNKKYGVLGLIKILSKPFKKMKTLWVKVAAIDKYGKTEYKKTISLADNSVIPYDADTWNPINCLLRTKAKTSRFIEQRTDKEAFQPVLS